MNVTHKIIWPPKNETKNGLKLNLTWYAPCLKNGKITKYNIQVDDDDPKYIKNDDSEFANITIDLKPNKKYKVKVYAGNDAGISNEAHEIQFKSPAGSKYH